MGREAFLSLWHDIPEYRTLVDGLRKGYREQAFFGLQPGQVAYLLAALRREMGRPVLALAPGYREALALATDLSAWLPGETVLTFPPLDVVPYTVMARSPEVAAQRLQVLDHLARGGEGIVVAPLTALFRALPPSQEFRRAMAAVRVGDEVPLPALIGRLVAGGYERVERVEGPGQFNVRGGLLDVFPLTAERPYRIEFFGDTVESLRSFDVISQRSVDDESAVLIPPAREAVLPEGGEGPALAAVHLELDQTVPRMEKAGRGAEARFLRERVDGHLARMTPALWELYLPYLYNPATLFDYFRTPPLVAALDAGRLLQGVEGAGRQWTERATSLLEEGRLLPSQEALQFGAEVWRRGLDQRQVLYLSGLPSRLPGADIKNLLSVSGKPVTAFHGQWELFLEELRGLRGQQYRCCLAVTSHERGSRVAAGLAEVGIDTVPGGEGEPWPLPSPGGVAVLPGTLQSGFVFPGLRLALITEGEIFGRRRQKREATRAPSGVKIASYRDLKVGDYVVHVQHGIGQYLGIKAMEVQGVQRDYLFIKYEAADRLYVPTDQIHLVQKYVGGEGLKPRLNRLGGNEWARVKQRVKESVRRMAEELLRLYAARQALAGYAFAADTVWQTEFEEAFPFEETQDQIQAVAEIKRDMEEPRPMDRLLCGDVGFGKTEVAMRAAFKAVMDGKQVAVLVPTTILAQQHYVTFKERFQAFPVRIQVLSRFRTPKEQEATITALRKGEADVVIGTHRLLGGDVSFKDLGLLIIDEEHRFGVSHKEALKRLRATVDVLTLTATPIPRTLHMSLAGLRDMSVIETPPENRFPVETYVVEYDEMLVRDAIERELGRGGQVFYVHNRVQTIGNALRRLRGLAPGAAIGVAHGQLPEEDLEQVMLDFLEGRHDILLCTSIIESGLDIPNANSLVVEDSDRFGLAQLYQIRGRVGRSNRLAYAYFTFRRERILTETAQKRLEAIKEFTELGSGFKIALRDLEIRGAGNILGPEQHGFIVSVGFDLYCQLLEEAVRELKGDKAVPLTEPTVELAVDAYLDDAYVPEARAKIEVYKKVNACRSAGELDDLEAEIVDRYGPLPRPARNLLSLARIKAAAIRLGLLSISQERDVVKLLFPGYLKELVRSLEPLRARYGRRLAVQTAPKPVVRLRLDAARAPLGAVSQPAGPSVKVVDEVLALLTEIAAVPEVRRFTREDVAGAGQAAPADML